MSAIAVGAYIRLLAEMQKIKLTDVTTAAGVRLKYLSEIEGGKVAQPGIRTLRKMTERVRGSWDDIGDLYDLQGGDENAVGRQRAIEWAIRHQIVAPRDISTMKSATREEIEQAARDLLDSLE